MIRIKIYVEIFLFLIPIVQSTKANYELESLQIVFRHGDRTPNKEELYPTLAYDPIYETLGYGQLTEVGKMREFRLGTMLRRRYSTFLGGHHKYGSVYAYSSDVERTKMSLQLVLAGLYPPTLSEEGRILLSPIAANYLPMIIDNLLFPISCPAFRDEYRKTKNSPAIQAKISQNKELFKYIGMHTGLNMTSDPIYSIYLLHILFTTQRSMNITLPPWATEDVQKKIVPFVKLEYDIQSYNTLLKRLNGGFLIKEFIKNMDTKKDGRSPKIYVYSGHEINIAAVARVHGLTKPEIPSFGSAIVVETLRNSIGKKFVKILHWTGVTEELITYAIPNCGEICPYEQYVKLMQYVIPSEKESDCLWNKISKDTLRLYYSGQLDLPKNENMF